MSETQATPIETGIVTFNSPYRKHIHWLVIDGVKHKVQFENHEYVSHDEKEIQAIRDEIALYQKKGLALDMLEHNVYEDMLARMPKELVVTVDGVPHKIPANEAIDAWVAQHVNKTGVNIGTLGSGQEKNDTELIEEVIEEHKAKKDGKK